jgi:hypothetical protein
MHGPGRKIRLGESGAAHDMRRRCGDMNDRCCGSDPEPAAHGIPSRMFSCLSHIVASHLKWREAQGRIRLEHVDNLADDVKFRRSNE